MPLTGSPPTYTRGYSFTQHSIDQPNVPQPGDQLDQEFDDIATAINASATVMQGITNPDGTLKNASVGQPQLVPGLFDQIVDDAEALLQPLVDSAAASASQANTRATAAQGSATAAASSASSAAAAVTTANAVMAAANAARDAASVDAADAADSAAEAENSANTSTAAMTQSIAAKDLSFQWAEYLAGPVDPAPPGWPEAIDDGRWSAKWWALYARGIVGEFGNFYLGAFPVDPPLASPPWPEGTLYFNTTTHVMMVWNGEQWVPLATPGLSIPLTYVYKATANQQVFSGVDANGNTPVLDPAHPRAVDVHVNGVRLVRDDGDGFGDYLVDPATSTLTIAVELPQDTIVQWDLLVDPSEVAIVSAVLAHKILNIAAGFNGVLTTFALQYNDGAGAQPALPTNGVQMQISLDSVLQEAGVDYTTSTSNIIFTQAPPAGTRFYGVWYEPKGEA